MSRSLPAGLEPWIFNPSDPKLISAITGLEDRRLFGTYVNEAIFFWRFLKPLLMERRPVQALEVGSGIGLLSMLASGHANSVISLEPESVGFGKMSAFRQAVVRAGTGKTMPLYMESFLSDLPTEQTFDLIYCINVLEHVPEPEKLIAEIYHRLNPGGLAWLVLPNYAFPYEQHFEIPIVLDKATTWRVFRQKIISHKVSGEPEGLWADLSWPTYSGVKNFLRASGWDHVFKKSVLSGYFDRLGEPLFIERKGRLYRILRPFVQLIRPAVIRMPLSVCPVIEVTLTKPDQKSPKSRDSGR